MVRSFNKVGGEGVVGWVYGWPYLLASVFEGTQIVIKWGKGRGGMIKFLKKNYSVFLRDYSKTKNFVLRGATLLFTQRNTALKYWQKTKRWLLPFFLNETGYWTTNDGCGLFFLLKNISAPHPCEVIQNICAIT